MRSPGSLASCALLALVVASGCSFGKEEARKAQRDADAAIEEAGLSGVLTATYDCTDTSSTYTRGDCGYGLTVRTDDLGDLERVSALLPTLDEIAQRYSPDQARPDKVDLDRWHSPTLEFRGRTYDVALDGGPLVERFDALDVPPTTLVELGEEVVQVEMTAATEVTDLCEVTTTLGAVFPTAHVHMDYDASPRLAVSGYSAADLEGRELTQAFTTVCDRLTTAADRFSGELTGQLFVEDDGLRVHLNAEPAAAAAALRRELAALAPLADVSVDAD